MSSAHNHRVRSSRGYKKKAAAFNNLQRKNFIVQETRRQMKQQHTLFGTLLKLFRKHNDK